MRARTAVSIVQTPENGVKAFASFPVGPGLSEDLNEQLALAGLPRLPHSTILSTMRFSEDPSKFWRKDRVMLSF